MLFMCIETFKNQDAKAVYRRFRDQGRQMPDGLTFVGSWVTADLDRCFQLMECDDACLLQQWVSFWSDLVAFRDRAGGAVSRHPRADRAPALKHGAHALGAFSVDRTRSIDHLTLPIDAGSLLRPSIRGARRGAGRSLVHGKPGRGGMPCSIRCAKRRGLRDRASLPWPCSG